MASASGQDSRWYLTVEQLQNSPSRRCGMEADQELNHRQKAAYLIQDMGQRLRVSQLCINTAIVYMHRFYAYHSFTYFHRNGIAAASLFLAAKVEEQPRKLETVIHIANACTASSTFNEVPDPSSKESYQEQAQDLVFNENVLLQTLGFDVAVDHPHTHVVKTCHLVKACKDLAQTSYFLASNSLHLTTMCLQYKPTVVACFCIYLACKWSGWEIPQSTEGKFWFHYVDQNVNLDLLEQLTREFLVIYEKSPARLKTKLNSCKGLVLNKVEQQQPRPMSQPSSTSSSRSHPAGEHSRSQSSHQRANHQKIPHAVPAGKEHVPSKSSSGQMPSKQPHSNVAAASSSSSASSLISNSSRPRPDRNDRPTVPEPHFSAPQRTAGSTKGPLPPLTRGNIDNMTQSANNMQAAAQQQQQQQRSSQSSHDQQYYQQQHANKNRMNPMAQPNPDLQRQAMKQEQRQHAKDQHQQPQQPKPIDSTKNQMKQQHSSGNSNLYPSNDNQPRASSGASRQPPYQQQLPNYNQAMAGRKVNHPQQQLQPEHVSVHQHKHAMPEPTFRLTDDPSSQNVDGMELNSPPKQQTIKVPSIFSPEWNDSVNVAPPPQRSANNGLNIKSNRDSPKKHRSDTPKKDKRNDLLAPPMGPTKVPSHSDKRGNGAKPVGMPQQNLSFDSTSTISKHLNAGVKRLLPDDMIKQENGTDFREAKHRKLDVQSLSPSSLRLDCKPNLSKLSMYPSENVPSTIYDNPMKGTSFNGIETNPDLVSSLLKESLCTDTKFQSSLSTVPHELLQQNLVKQEPSKYESYEPSATLPQQLFETSTLPAQIKLEPGMEHGQRIKTEKKKKKDKHKHKDKDKDKTKDREERKKHKKDKDRQKDRERSTDMPAGDGHNPLKITIPRDKLISPQDATPGGFKITIPRDRIKPEPPAAAAAVPPAPLKIKISKDFIESYAGGPPNNPSDGNSHSHSSSKKKDKERDRDREKSKSSKHSDFTKQNGNNSNGSNGNGSNPTATGANNTNSRNQSSNSNKMIPQYNNIQPQSQYMQHPQYMQQKMPIYSDNMGSTSIPFNSGNPGGNVNQMPPNRLPPQQLQQQQLQQQQLNHSQSMIDTTKYSNHANHANHSNHYPFVGNTWRQ